MNTTPTNTVVLNKAVLLRYLDLPQPENKIMATYIWIDGTGENLRGIILSQIDNHFSHLLLFFSIV